MNSLTFHKYRAGHGAAAPPVQWLVGVPGDLDVPEVVAAAGFDPDAREAVRLAYLERPWQGHPAGALVVAEVSTLSSGDVFSVSEQPVVSPA